MLRDFPGALPGVQQLAFILEESQLVASDRQSLDSECSQSDRGRGFNSEQQGEDDFYNQLNDCLRERNAQKMALLRPYLAYLMRALAKFPAVETIVYRGIPTESLDMHRKYKRCARVHWSAFT